MKMSHREALKVLGLDVSVNFEAIKQAYRRLSSKYHPDRNPAGLEMMKMINAAWMALSDFVEGSVKADASEAVFNADEYSEAINDALNAVVGLEGLVIEICGSWVWVSGDTRQHKETLKEAGFRWAPKKMMWSFNPSPKKRKFRSDWTMDQIRSAHGSVNVRGFNNNYARIEA